MTAFVILAAGAGSRVGGELHKALLPLDGRAVISHQIAAAPDARIIVCLGHNGQQIKDYLDLAHPTLPVTFVDVPGWAEPGGGPGASLLAARSEVGTDDMIFTSCDTLWEKNPDMWRSGTSWCAIAPIPSFTEFDRWCRVDCYRETPYGHVAGVYDKDELGDEAEYAYTGLACIRTWDLNAFWTGIEDSENLGGERQVTGGLKKLQKQGRLCGQLINWTDVGDADAYRREIVKRSGYDWSKPGEATYVLPEEGRVVKFTDKQTVLNMAQRHRTIQGVLPELIDIRPDMYSYRYVYGRTAYQAAKDDPDLVLRLLAWAEHTLWKPVPVDPEAQQHACKEFYVDKTVKRVKMLRQDLQVRAWDLLAGINWVQVCARCEPVTYHGDFNFGNIIVTESTRGWDGFTLIDWRSDFAGKTLWGDKRYDLAKLIAGLYVNWDQARQGNFDDWTKGLDHLDKVKRWLGGWIPSDIMVIAALSLLNSAPLHKAPLDELLVETAAKMLEVL